MHFGSAHICHRAPPRLPLQPRRAQQMKSVITLDLWLNRLWQRRELGNAIGLRVCIAVFADKSSGGERARCGDRGITPAYAMPSVDVRNGGHLVLVGQRVCVWRLQRLARSQRVS